MSLGLGLYLSRRLKTLKRYLLNVFTGAAAAYSLRKLEKDATYAVRVRRSTDNSELDIGFNNLDQLDTTALLDFVNVRNEYPADYDTGAAAAYSLRYVTERPDTKPADFGSGAAAAYSLRYVSDSYSGAVVRVRRDTDQAEKDFAPSEITDGTMTNWVNTKIIKSYDSSTDSNLDGLANDFSLNTFSGITTTIISGNGHIGKAQKIEYNSGITGLRSLIITTPATIRGQTITISFLYRSNKSYVPTNGSSAAGFSALPINTSDAIRYQETNVWNVTGGSGNVIYLSSWLDNPGDFFEISDLSITFETTDGLVTTWYDQSGNSNDATQSNASSQPKIVDAGTLVTENGKPAVDFDGVDDYLQPSFKVSLQNIAMQFVYNYKTLANSGMALLLAEVPQSYNGFNSTIETRNSFLGGGVAQQRPISKSTNQRSWSLYANSSSAAFYLDSVKVGADMPSNNNAPSSQNLTIGNLYNGSIAANIKAQELIIYQTDQSSNRKNIEWDINDYYGIYSQWDRESVVRVRRSVDNAEADFNPTEITDGTLLSWINGVNLLTYSNQFDTTWTTSNSSITSGQSGYDGSSDAWLLTASAQLALLSQNISGTSIYSFSVYAKANTQNSIFIRLTGSVSGRAFFDLQNGIVINPTNVVDSQIENIGNGWYRCTIVSSDTISDARIYVGDNTQSFPSSGSIYIQDAQLELGSTATTYTETTDAPAGYGYVTTWYDQSGNSNDATQGTAASQPKIVDAGVLVEENGKPAVDFDGIDDGLEATDNATLDFTTMAFAGVFGIDSIDDTAISKRSSTEYSFDITGSSSLIRLGINDNTNRPSLAMSGRSLVWANYDKVNEALGVNGGALSTTPNNADITNSSESLWIGRRGSGLGAATAWFDGLIQELILYPSDQSSNRGNIEANVNDYYSIYTSTNDGFVTTWYDQAGSNDATQATAAAQPQIVDGGSLITENGKVAVQFDSVNVINLLASTSAFSQPNTIFALGTVDSITGNGQAIIDGITSRNLINISNTGKYQIFSGTAIFSSNNATTNQNLYSALFDGVSSSLYVNEVQEISGNAGTVALDDIRIGHDYNLGGTGSWDGNIQEIIIYNSDQSGNRTAIEGNINKNYQVYWDGAGYSLLDNFAGAEAAYALVPLSSTYRGAIVKVRRASDNAERDIYANYDGTLDTASLLDFCSGTDGYVSVWYDQSGNGNNAVQSTAASQPQIVSGGSLITSNGYTVIQYDGSDDNLTTSLTETGTMLMGGSDGSAFYEVAISGSYPFLASASITEHPLNESIRVIWGSSLTTAQKTAIEAAVTYTDWDFSDVTDFYRYWRDRSELTDFPLIDTSSGTNFTDAWFSCSSLTSFPALDLSSGTNFEQAWRSCSSLTSFPLLDVSSGTNFNFAWRLCSSLTSFPALDLSSGTFFISTWNGCSSLQDFPANMFDSVTATNFLSAFLATNLTQTSIDNILTSIDTANTSNGTFNQSGGSAPSAVGEAAIENLISRGWNITVTGGYQTYPTYKYRVETDGGTLYASRACTETAINDLKAL